MNAPTGYSWSRCGKVVCTISVLVSVPVVVLAAYLAWRFLPNHAVKYEGIEDHFKYGSTGGEANLGFPFWIWQAAPLVCGETLTKIAGDRLAPDFLKRVATHDTKATGQPELDRRRLSREAYKAFGMIYETVKEEEKDLPVGVSKRRHMGLDRVFMNCASCHSSTVRDKTGEPQLVLGMPANLFNLRNFEHFYFECAAGAQFSKENLIPEIEYMGEHLGFIDRYVVYPLAIWIMRDRVQYLMSRLGFSYKQPEWGPGRVDTFSNAKGIFKWPWQHLPDWNKDKRVDTEQIGTADFPSIWLQRPRKMRSDGCQMELHWDGNNDTVEERNLSAAFGTGALPPIVDHESIGRIEDWLLKAKPDRFKKYFPDDLDERLAQAGKPIYKEYCSRCHGADGHDFTGDRVGFVTPIDEIKTDRYRLDNYTHELAVVQSTLYADERKPDAPKPPVSNSSKDTSGPAPVCKKSDPAEEEENSYRFKHFHKTQGYANMPLDGIWLRAPYLHNGSVPTLWDLLQPPRMRPRAFYRGNDFYDPKKVGFVSDKPAEPNGAKYFKFDTTVPGNSNSGHEYGTELNVSDKWALVEYLKTF
jgi:mono/diheme cytochrome c family protein